MSLIILDRDGVINHDSGEVIASPADWTPIDGSLEAIARLNQAGYRVVVITNQPGISEGHLDVETLTKVHSKMRRMLTQVGGKIEAILYCPHKAVESCNCWQPRESAYSELSNRLRIDLSNVPVISASLMRIETVTSVNAKPILVRTGYAEISQAGDIPAGVDVYDDLAAVVTHLLDPVN